ncbi:MAG: hypothetical protein JSV85_02405 [Candidatus Bathyarchaeota archaeon]|nr:MAG: hypothetical protein JSV85_02405 [Candidatus Bathyarchaeota archaeon]
MNREWVPFVILFLTAGIVVGCASSYERISRLESEFSILTTESSNLNVAYEQLEDDYSDLNSAHNELKSNHTLLQSETLTLTTNYSILNVAYNILLGNYSSLDSAHHKLQENYSQLEELHEFLNVSYSSLNLRCNELQEDYEEATGRIAELEQVVEYEIYELLNQEYYHSMKDELGNANETILVAMYTMKYDPSDSDDWGNDLIRELVNASGRGVNVTVIIENRTYSPQNLEEKYMSENLEAYQYLLDNNVTVKVDNENDTDHMKLVVIDNRVVYVGSHNWSESGLYYNSETSVKIISEDVAEVFTTYFATI